MKSYSNKQVQCDICGQYFSVYGIASHKKWHENEAKRQEERRLNPKKRGPKPSYVNYAYLQLKDNLFCQYCGKQCKNLNSLKQHEIRCPNNADRLTYNSLTEYVLKNIKGKTKQTCPQIQKQVDTMRQKLDSGWRAHYDRTTVVHLYKHHNDQEIQKWIDYVSNLHLNLPTYKIYKDGDYVVISDSVLTNQYNSKYGTSTILHEHVYLMMQIFGEEFSNTNVVHHIDEIKSNNCISNLLLFESKSDHVRFHVSNKAYLLYDGTTHKFSCIVK